jgi:mRNA interferase RelE/StbE
MASYKVISKPSVHKDLSQLPKPLLLRVLKQFRDLETDPFSTKALKLTGAERLYRIRVGDYRIIYEVNTEARVIIVHYVRHRREAYRRL